MSETRDSVLFALFGLMLLLLLINFVVSNRQAIVKKGRSFSRWTGRNLREGIRKHLRRPHDLEMVTENTLAEVDVSVTEIQRANPETCQEVGEPEEDPENVYDQIKS